MFWCDFFFEKILSLGNNFSIFVKQFSHQERGSRITLLRSTALISMSGFSLWMGVTELHSQTEIKTAILVVLFLFLIISWTFWFVGILYFHMHFKTSCQFPPKIISLRFFFRCNFCVYSPQCEKQQPSRLMSLHLRTWWSLRMAEVGVNWAQVHKLFCSFSKEFLYNACLVYFYIFLYLYYLIISYFFDLFFVCLSAYTTFMYLPWTCFLEISISKCWLGSY